MKAPKIVCVHLFNDYSGSPLVLAQAIRTLSARGHAIDLYTSKSSVKGFLSNIESVNYFFFRYKWSKIKLLTLFKFLTSQTILFFTLLKYRRQDVIFYINTILPWGAALAGKLLGKRVVYHVHETSVKPVLLKKMLFYIANKSAQDLIYVSHFLKEQEPLTRPNAFVVYNTLSTAFSELAAKHSPPTQKPFTVLMLASLKAYKGVNEFVELAKQLPNYHFELVLNAPEDDVNTYFAAMPFTGNIAVYAVQSNVHPFYERANLVLNLSHPDKWVETFGMTALEAMSYGIPVIVPPVGGITEVVTHGTDGYLVDVRDMAQLIEKVQLLFENKTLYHTFSKNARKSSCKYSPKHFSDGVCAVFFEQ